MKRLGVILAGGHGVRLGGRNKALLRMGGETLAARAVRVLRPLVDEIVISGPDPEALAQTGLPFLRDVEGMSGPLAGIVAAARSGCYEFFALGVDQIGVTSATLDRLRAAAEKTDPGASSLGVAALSDQGQIYPTVMTMRSSRFPDLERALNTGCGSAIDLLRGLGFAPVPALVAEFIDLDTPEDLKGLGVE